ncbi:hypothetical protein FPOAC1_004240 [Fusarium poae]|uniref:hypothetical protein n=1 Tax=Fusarium poae TaxID=36050 RepID=UPI001CEB67A9|nr:hypothetical protein FPOAC1_004240 [Fusarium poae]KAG8671003.1 hypothetical protein FPOAC1_004240 [Fusarium poae]
MATTKLTHNDYTVGWVCALPKEQTAALAMLDCEHPPLSKHPSDKNAYSLGEVQGHNVVIACLPKGIYGTNPAATVAARMLDTFPSIKFGLMVGIGAGIPPQVRLGDVVVSTPIKQHPGVVQWDFGESVKGGQFKKIGALNNPPTELLTALSNLESKRTMTGYKIPQYLEELASKYPKLVPKYIKSDSLKDPLDSPAGVQDDRVGLFALLLTMWRMIASLFELLPGWQTHSSSSLGDGKPHGKQREMQVHYGLIASGNRLIKDSVLRDSINRQMNGHVLCNKDWQEHAAAVAAAFAKDLLSEVQVTEVCQMSNAKIFLEMKAGLDDVSEKVTHLHSARLTQDHRDILEWLSPIDYSSVQNDTFRRRQPGTCQWLIDSEQYQTWLKTSKQTLFCPGIPGAGKTILTSVVIDNLVQRFYKDSDVGIAYIYCNYRRQDDQRIDKILASILKQLTERQPSLATVVQDLYDQHKSHRTWPFVDELSEALRSLVKEYGRVYIIVDALDECGTSGGARSKLLKQLMDLKENSDVNLFMTSRDMPDIEEKLQGDIITLKIRASEEDVGCFLDSRLNSLSELVKKNKDLRDNIRAKVIEAVDGMFLLADLHVRSLEGMFLPNQIREALETLPTGTTAYDETYKGVMQRIESQANTKTFAKAVLTWITCARRPLTTSELRHALAVQVHNTDLDESNLPEIGDAVAVCAGLVVVDKESNIIRLAHYTTQQYFEKTKGDWFPNAHADITTACITYLSYKTFQRKPTEPWDSVYEKLRSYRFYDYVAINWGHHGRKSQFASKELMEFLQSDRPLETAVEAFMVTTEDLGSTDFVKEGGVWRKYNRDVCAQLHRLGADVGRMEGLHLAAYFGIAEAIAVLLRDGKDPNVKDHHDLTPLARAAKNGHVAAVKVLLENGADANSSDRDGRTSLSLAAENGHEHVVGPILATEGVDADSRDAVGNSPLYYAAVEGHMAVFDRLLSTDKVDINAECKINQTPVIAAVRRGHIGIIARLLNNSQFDVNIRDKDGMTLLHHAVEKEHENIVASLLTVNEIQVDTRDKWNGTTLSKAVRSGSGSIVKMLIDSGKVDVNARVGQGEIVLQTATSPETMRALLESSQVQVDARGSNGRTALMTAVSSNREEEAKLLLATCRAGTNMTDSYGQTPFSKAVYMRNEPMVRIFLESGQVDVNAKDGHGKTPLQWAVIRYNKSIIWWLLEHGAEFDEEIRASMKPLSESSWEEIRVVITAVLNMTRATMRSNNSAKAIESKLQVGL